MQDASEPEVWQPYFPGVPYNADDRRAVLFVALVDFFKTQHGWTQYCANLRPSAAADSCYVLPLALDLLMQQSGITDLLPALQLQPMEGLTCLSASVCQVVFYIHRQLLPNMPGIGEDVDPGRVYVQPHCTSTEHFHVHIREAQKSASIGKLVNVRGTVVRMGRVRPLVVAMDFVCGKCGSRQVANFPEGKFTPPTRCEGDSCRSKSFAPVRSSARCEDWQKVRVQEMMGADSVAQGQVPACLEVELRGDLVRSCCVGDTISCTGLLKVLESGEDLGKLGGSSGGGGGGGRNGGRFGGGRGGGGGSKQELFLIYMDALSVTNKRGASQAESEGRGMPAAEVAATCMPGVQPLTNVTLRFIWTFCHKFPTDGFRQFVHSLCPGILGHDLVKAGLLLALFGGVRKNVGVTGRLPLRGNIHVLLVGDPSLGKSQLLRAAAAASPRGLYVCGNSSSSAGLTVSVAKDPVTGDFVFDAGAVVLADRGVCCVDEFDKMTDQHQVLLEAMEQQEVSVGKAGLVATLPARTSILAGANPSGPQGKYDRLKTVSENLRSMSAPMLSRFDLVFILEDRADTAMDAAISAHVMAQHSGRPDQQERQKRAFLAWRKQQDASIVQRLPALTYTGMKASSHGDHRQHHHSNDSIQEHGQQDVDMDDVSQRHDQAGRHPAHGDQTRRGSSLGGDGGLHNDSHGHHGAASSQGGSEGPQSAANGSCASQDDGGQLAVDEDTPLAVRLHLSAREVHEPVPVHLLRKYIAYAQQYCHPVLSEEAREELKGFYLHLRDTAKSGISMPVTARALESLIRLAEARARVDLREVVTGQDARDVVEIMRGALYDRFQDKYTCHTAPAKQGAGSRPGSKAAEASRFMAALRREASNRGKLVFSLAELRSFVDDIRVSVPDVFTFLEQLNDAGELLKAGAGEYKVTGVPALRPPSSTASQASGAARQGYSQNPSQRLNHNPSQHFNTYTQDCAPGHGTQSM